MAYGSYSNPMPDAFDCDFQKHIPYKIIVPGLKEKFKSNWYYLSFNAAKGVNISVTTYFTSSDTFDRRKPQERRSVVKTRIAKLPNVHYKES